MQISRIQNQPNFKSRVKPINPKAMATHLQGSDLATYKRQKAELKAIGDEKVAFGICYNPRSLGPFAILGQIVSQKTGETTVKFREGLHLSQLAKNGKEMHEEMQQELSAAPIYKKVQKPKEDLEKDIAEITE